MAGKVACLYCEQEYCKTRDWQKFCTTSCADRYRYKHSDGRKSSIIEQQKKNQEKIKEQVRDNPNRKHTHWKTKLKLNFGITPEIYKEMYESQAGLCKICENEIEFIHKNTHVDHCHTTGKVRGLLCHHCNLGLGHFKDNIKSLSSAINYLGET